MPSPPQKESREFTAPAGPVESEDATIHPPEDILSEPPDDATLSPDAFEEDTVAASVVAPAGTKEASQDDRIKNLMGSILGTSKIPAYVLQAMRGFPIGVLEVLY